MASLRLLVTGCRSDVYSLPGIFWDSFWGLRSRLTKSNYHQLSSIPIGCYVGYAFDHQSISLPRNELKFEVLCGNLPSLRRWRSL